MNSSLQKKLAIGIIALVIILILAKWLY
ncbi:MAG: hypothetical protein RLZZ337_747, partial [Bacteroidota bacterium]